MTANTTDAARVRSLSFDRLVWHPVDDHTPDGPKMAVLLGDPGQGEFGALLRVPAGFQSPRHTHSQDERVVQLRGWSIHWTSGNTKETAPAMQSGDYLMMPRGVAHVSATPAEAESLEFITMDGPFDFTIADPDPEVRR